MAEQTTLVTHRGGCHCGAVRFQVQAPADLSVYNCNCSICVKKHMRPFLVERNMFTLLQGKDNLTTYTFHTKTAKHSFCKTCGVECFYQPRMMPDNIGILVNCLDPGTVNSMKEIPFEGKDWE